MARIPYEIMAPEANNIIVRMASSSNPITRFQFWNQYISYIENCGWSDQEFDRETLKRIDRNWE